MLKFKSGGGFHGGLEYGYQEGWHWWRDGGDYYENRDFFWVHWEVHDKDPHNIRLHVECPKAADDPELNALKEEVIEALMSPHLEGIVEQQGYEYKAGTRTSLASIRANKSTEPFRVILTDDQMYSTNQENLALVHTVVGSAVDAVLQEFMPQLKQFFRS